MIDRRRLLIEKQALEFGFPNRYVIQNLYSRNAFVDVGLRTNTGRTFRLKMVLNDFPYTKPEVYVIHPKNLKNYYGDLLSDIGVSSSMHLLAPDNNKNIQLCHYSDQAWSTNITLYKVALKCLIWLNAYDGHLRTGQPMDYFLKHQPS